jgi:hypothetical protein
VIVDQSEMPEPPIMPVPPLPRVWTLEPNRPTGPPKVTTAQAVADAWERSRAVNRRQPPRLFRRGARRGGPLRRPRHPSRATGSPPAKVGAASRISASPTVRKRWDGTIARHARAFSPWGVPLAPAHLAADRVA